MSNFQKHEMAISIVVCTQNRADLLEIAMQSLCEQTLPHAFYEIVIVDNDSKDHTGRVAEFYCQRQENVRYCVEPQHGLSHARNRGWQVAKGRYVAYVDDDCKVPPQWLTVAHNIIADVGPAAFGGPYYPCYHSPKPYWWKDGYGTFEQSHASRALGPREYLRGGNIFIRREVLEDLSGFDPTLGMTEGKLGYGEETYLQKRIRETMLDECIYYASLLYVYHLVRPEKMTLRWALKSWFVNGRSSYHLSRADVSRTAAPSPVRLVFQMILTIKKFFADLLFGSMQRDRKRYPYLQNYLYENTMNHVANMGALYEKYTHCP
jgi:glycosyltransferase involved in cell wall biosynthesis